MTTPTPPEPTRAGFVTLLGAPNAGKSTLLNRFVGERLSIVTSKAQTTWTRVTGLRTDDRTQFIFLDTPGILDPVDLLQRSLMMVAENALRNADLLLLVLDAARPPAEPFRVRLTELVERARAPVLAALNKIDAATEQQVEAEEAWAGGELGVPVYRISATEGEGVDELLDALRERLPTGPFLYPSDDIATEPVRYFAAELVRETIFERFRQEIPYSVFCQVEEFREEKGRIYVQVNIFVERPSQKGILIGKGGEAIRELGTEARRKLEHFLERSVYLDLWVKVLPNWRKRRSHLRRLGLPIPTDDDA